MKYENDVYDVMKELILCCGSLKYISIRQPGSSFLVRPILLNIADGLRRCKAPSYTVKFQLFQEHNPVELCTAVRYLYRGLQASNIKQFMIIWEMDSILNRGKWTKECESDVRKELSGIDIKVVSGKYRFCKRIIIQNEK